MKLQQHYSSSSGSLYTVTARSGRRLLLECGVTWPKLQKALDYDLASIDGCLLSHEHKDHSKAVRDVLRAGISVTTGHGTFDALGLDVERNVGVVGNQARAWVGEFDVYAFEVNHDAAEPLGFVIMADSEYLLFATDTSHIRQRFLIPCDIIAIECSYDQDVLKERVDADDINETLAKRLLTSHMSKQNAIHYIADFCNRSKCREIHLIHMSRDNIDAEKARQEVEDRFFIETIIV